MNIIEFITTAFSDAMEVRSVSEMEIKCGENSQCHKITQRV